MTLQEQNVAIRNYIESIKGEDQQHLDTETMEIHQHDLIGVALLNRSINVIGGFEVYNSIYGKYSRNETKFTLTEASYVLNAIITLTAKEIYINCEISSEKLAKYRNDMNGIVECIKIWNDKVTAYNKAKEQKIQDFKASLGEPEEPNFTALQVDNGAN